MMRGSIHLWRIDLAGAPAVQLERVLAASEVERSRRFKFERDRIRYLGAHAALRRILAGYLAVEPRDVPIAVEPAGKPVLPTGAGSSST